MNRETKQRKVIYDVVVNHLDHPDVETIYNEVHKIDIKISRSTIYRNLNILSELGLINHIRVPGGDRYDLTTINHSHIMCKLCGRVIDAPIEYNSENDKKVEKESGFKIINHQTLYEGICAECLNKFKGGEN